MKVDQIDRSTDPSLIDSLDRPIPPPIPTPGTWALPGGHLEMGESVQETAVREIKEVSKNGRSCHDGWLAGAQKCDRGD